MYFLGSASLYYVVKSDSHKAELNPKMKKKILHTLLNGMIAHKELYQLIQLLLLLKSVKTRKVNRI